MVNIYLKSQYLPQNEEQRPYIPDILSEENIPYFEATTDYFKTMTEYENMDLKNKAFLGGWISIAQRVYSRENNLKIGYAKSVK